MQQNKWIRRLVNFGAIALAWTFIMDYFQTVIQDKTTVLMATLFVVFIIYSFVDEIFVKMMRGRR